MVVVDYWYLSGISTGQIQLNDFINYMGECTLSKFVMCNARLGGTIDSLVDTAAIQKDLTKLEKRAENLTEFSKGRCKVVHIEQNNLVQQNRLGTDYASSGSSTDCC